MSAARGAVRSAAHGAILAVAAPGTSAGFGVGGPALLSGESWAARTSARPPAARRLGCHQGPTVHGRSKQACASHPQLRSRRPGSGGSSSNRGAPLSVPLSRSCGQPTMESQSSCQAPLLQPHPDGSYIFFHECCQCLLHVRPDNSQS
ncbi:hypothetical protein GQ55_8G087600 [Panicum hallii var. hallii]|uniref:Uncharacterized protein n=1 Tax=Panicum hallii var. hallii TaxID=1504633 RepID=A0A2T7CM30_9POAL|nr:hypothetical protein GQ55_8G087600 [Panicum hallii var. hallii]